MSFEQQRKAPPRFCIHNFLAVIHLLLLSFWPITEGNRFSAPLINMQILIVRRKESDGKKKEAFLCNSGALSMFLPSSIRWTYSVESNLPPLYDVQSGLVTLAIPSVQVKIN